MACGKVLLSEDLRFVAGEKQTDKSFAGNLGVIEKLLDRSTGSVRRDRESKMNGLSNGLIGGNGGFDFFRFWVFQG